MVAKPASGKSFCDLYEEYRENIKTILDKEIPAERPLFGIREALYVLGVADNEEAIQASEQLLEHHIDRALLTNAQRELVEPVKKKIKELRRNLLPRPQTIPADSASPGG